MSQCYNVKTLSYFVYVKGILRTLTEAGLKIKAQHISFYFFLSKLKYSLKFKNCDSKQNTCP